MQSSVNNDPKKELEAMQRVADALSDLSEEGVTRVLSWAAGVYGTKAIPPSQVGTHRHSTRPSSIEELPAEDVFEDVADLYASANPGKEAERVLVVGYWFQEVQGSQTLDAYTVNNELKHLGHGASNITRAFNSLMKHKPSLVLQVRKTGKTKQARKLYKLTHEGVKEVERMIRREVE